MGEEWLRQREAAKQEQADVGRRAAGDQPAEDEHVGEAEGVGAEDRAPGTVDLDRSISEESDAPTFREELERFAGPEGLSAQQIQDDEAYVAAYGDDRPWLRMSEEPLVRHVYCERDRHSGHDPARHDGWERPSISASGPRG